MKICSVLFVGLLSLALGEAEAQLLVSQTGTAYVITFDSTVSGVNTGQYAGSGFQASPTSGQLDSDAFAVTGWSDGNLAFGGSQTGGDYARGAVTAAQTTGGMYAFGTTDRKLMIQQGGSDWAPGTLTLRIRNTTGSAVTGWILGYELYVRNDQARGNSFNFSYSTDGTNFVTTGLSSPNFAYTSGAAADANGWGLVGTPSNTISATVANSGYLYIRWSGADVSGSGSRDEFGIDDISVLAVPEPSSAALAFGGIGMMFAFFRRKRS